VPLKTRPITFLVECGIGLADPVQQIPLLFAHYELSAGIDYLNAYEGLLRFEGSTYVDVYRYADLAYISGFTAATLGFRYFPFNGFFGTIGGGIAYPWSDSGYNADSLSTYNFSSMKTPINVMFAGLGYSSDIYYLELRKYFGLKKIAAFDRRPTSFAQ